MSIVRVIDLIETGLDKLPYAEDHYELVKQTADRQQERLDYLENRIRTLKKEKNRIVTLTKISFSFFQFFVTTVFVTVFAIRIS
jgi:hypothetical protein